MPSTFDATNSMLGYLYQVRLALVEALVRLRDEASFLIQVEKLDDVSFESQGKPSEILQIKHHQTREGNLADTSTDVWKSIRVWLEGRANGTLAVDALLYLVTTSVADPGTAAYALRTGSMRDVALARSKLDAAAQSSSNLDTVKGRTAYLALSASEREQFLRTVVVLDRSPGVLAIEDQLNQELFHAAEPVQLAALTTRLEGWWHRRVLLHLNGFGPILSEELLAQIADLREQFKRDNLPIDDDLLDEFDDEALSDRPFIEQLKLANIRSQKRILYAMKDYFRAFQQRSRWVREDLLIVGDVDNYEDRLKEEWERRFERMRDDFGINAAEEEKRRAAATLYGWVETEASFPIKVGCMEPFVTRGSYQMLADRGHVGWHPEFRDRLRQLFEDAR